MNEINQGLKDDLDSLKQIARYATTAAKVTEGLAKIATKIAAIVAWSDHDEQTMVFSILGYLDGMNPIKQVDGSAKTTSSYAQELFR